MNWRRKRASEGLARGRVGGIRSKTDMNTWPRSLPVSQDRLWLRGWWRHDICRVPQRRRRVQCGQPDQGRRGVERGCPGGHTARHTQGLVVTQQHMWSHSNSCGHTAVSPVVTQLVTVPLSLLSRVSGLLINLHLTPPPPLHTRAGIQTKKNISRAS